MYPDPLTATIQAAVAGTGKLSAVEHRQACLAAHGDFVRQFGNSREAALTLTKLQEADHWARNGDRDEVRRKLVEALSWAGEAVAKVSDLEGATNAQS